MGERQRDLGKDSAIGQYPIQVKQEEQLSSFFSNNGYSYSLVYAVLGDCQLRRMFRNTRRKASEEEKEEIDEEGETERV